MAARGARAAGPCARDRGAAAQSATCPRDLRRAVPPLHEGDRLGSGRADEMTLSRKGAKSRTRITGLRSKTTKATTDVDRLRAANTDLRKKLAEALEQQTATSEVLRVISSSPTDLAPVFDTILTNATRLCEGNFALLCRYDGAVLVGEATCHGTPEFTEKFMGSRITPGREGPTRLAALERRTVHVADMTVEPGFSPMVLQYERARTVLAVPFLRETNLV